MKLTLTLETDNAAFQTGSELSRILHKLAAMGQWDNLHSYHGEGEQKLRDINGNVCGTWSIVDEEDIQLREEEAPTGTPKALFGDYRYTCEPD